MTPEKHVRTPLDGLLALARVEHPEWWRAWDWIEDHSEALEDPKPPYTVIHSLYEHDCPMRCDSPHAVNCNCQGKCHLHKRASR